MNENAADMYPTYQPRLDCGEYVWLTILGFPHLQFFPATNQIYNARTHHWIKPANSVAAHTVDVFYNLPRDRNGGSYAHNCVSLSTIRAVTLESPYALPIQPIYIDGSTIGMTGYLIGENWIWSNYNRRYLDIFYPSVYNERGNMNYPKITFTKDGHAVSMPIHRLIATAYLHNPWPDRLTAVNHIDRNVLNWHWTNLEWCDAAYNVMHSHIERSDDPNFVQRLRNASGMLKSGSYSCVDIAEITGVPINTVYNLKHGAFKYIRWEVGYVFPHERADLCRDVLEGHVVRIPKYEWLRKRYPQIEWSDTVSLEDQLKELW